MKQLFIVLILVILWSCQTKNDVLMLESPSGNLKILVSNEQGKVTYQLFTKTDSSESIVLAPSPLGLVRSDGNFAKGLTFVKRTETKSVSDSYTMVSGKQKELTYMANEAGFTFQNQNSQQMEIIFRLFDEGLAFRYFFPGQSDSVVWVVS